MTFTEDAVTRVMSAGATRVEENTPPGPCQITHGSDVVLVVNCYHKFSL